jgi:hypothetical protein
MESRVAPKIVVNRRDFGKNKPGPTLLVGSIEPIERLLAISQLRVIR